MSQDTKSRYSRFRKLSFTSPIFRVIIIGRRPFKQAKTNYLSHYKTISTPPLHINDSRTLNKWNILQLSLNEVIPTQT